MVPPFKVTAEPTVGVNDKATFTPNVAPLLIVRPEVVSVLVDVPACRTVPSSTVIELAVCAAPVVIVNKPVAFVPAEKIAASPLTQVVPADAPVESVVQFAVEVFQ